VPGTQLSRWSILFPLELRIEDAAGPGSASTEWRSS
jgi:hypothetical protein